MAGTNSGTENVAFDSVSAHGKPVTLKEELPGYSGVGSAPPTDEFDDPPLVKRTERVETTRVSKPVGNGDEGDSELKQKVTVNPLILEELWLLGSDAAFRRGSGRQTCSRKSRGSSRCTLMRCFLHRIQQHDLMHLQSDAMHGLCPCMLCHLVPCAFGQA